MSLQRMLGLESVKLYVGPGDPMPVTVFNDGEDAVTVSVVGGELQLIVVDAGTSRVVVLAPGQHQLSASNVVRVVLP